MRNVLEELHSEHANMARLLNMLENQIETFEARGSPDYELMSDIVLYFLDYPDQCHHPKEDIVAEKLIERAPDRAAALRGLAAQHEELATLTRKVAKIVHRVLDEAELPREQVIRTVKEFIASQRHHMAMEEQHFLPLAEEIFDQADLEALESDIFQKEDPLFGEKVEEHFAMLRDSILKWEDADESA